ncbi:hypothetical protein NPIL_676721 [Nephila pilipes]|uniref:Uncharacterized protein n=1 Tax=Nephila pilipes TaxID=299642 RepID=A0A8X6T4N5_NEPPI|nr:hypothetical protein NPIL_676721 [Nephila pilipes]
MRCGGFAPSLLLDLLLAKRPEKSKTELRGAMNGAMAFLTEISQMHISQLTGVLLKTKVFHEALKLPINDHSKYLINLVTLASSFAFSLLFNARGVG